MSEDVTTVVVDLDNTLWDWVSIWHATFRAQLDKLVELSGLPESVLTAEIRAVHQRHGTSEYAFLIEELPSLKARHPGEDLAARYAPAIEAFRRVRRQALRLYPGVLDSLLELRARGVRLVAYTESQAFHTTYRIRQLGLDGVLDYIYSPPDHDLPPGLDAGAMRKHDRGFQELRTTHHRHTPKGELKPNADLLLSILEEVGARRDRSVYVGDSLMKDITMAQDAGVRDVYARYGNVRESAAYELLQAVTHWTDVDVERERAIVARNAVVPTYTLDDGLAQLLDLFRWGPCQPRTHGRHATARLRNRLSVPTR